MKIQELPFSPIFIVSSGRSGTTLLRGILNASAEIYIPLESDFIARGYPFYSDKNIRSEEDYKCIVKLFQLASQANGWGMDEAYLLRQLQQSQPESFAEVNRAIYDAYMKSEGLAHMPWGIKHPVLIASIDKILNVFPNARIIHIVRDGRDVCLSYQSVHKNAPQKFGPNSPLTAALYWIDGLRRVQESKAQKNRGAQLYEFRYEDMLNSPERILKSLFEFLELDFTDNLCQTYQYARSTKNLLLSQEKATIHSKVSSGIDAKNQNKFLTHMSLRQRFVFELIASPYLKKYDYRIEFPLLAHPVFEGLRGSLYVVARLFNNWRYSRRDSMFFQRSLQ